MTPEEFQEEIKRIPKIEYDLRYGAWLRGCPDELFDSYYVKEELKE